MYSLLYLMETWGPTRYMHNAQRVGAEATAIFRVFVLFLFYSFVFVLSYIHMLMFFIKMCLC